MKLDEIEGATGRPSLIGRISGGLRTAFRGGVDLAMPPNCLACGRRVAADGALCPACWGTLRLIEKPYCAQLGIPFAYDLGPNVLSAEAIADPPPFERCRAVAAYDDVSRKLVHGLKYRDRQELARWMGVWMARAGQEVVAEADVIVPVPLHRWRLWRRRFNQSAMLAAAIGREARKPVDLHGLKRVKATRQQVGLTANERDDNVRGAFLVARNERAAIAGRRVLLVDDVYTTGATVKAATRALLRAGAAAVDVLVFARVVRGVQ
ncbi:MAG: ComF family protein [Rhizobiales bacterium]|nr:ComF family protein [Hyphomicrobiales bacterium]MBN9010524.1 ComF family protein [Hyphomicrobiales bacterium]